MKRRRRCSRAPSHRSEHQVARAIYDDILAADPEHPGALPGIARQMRVRSDRAGARAMLGRAFESAQARSMPTFELWVELGTLETDARNLAAARLAYDKALADAPGFLPALLGAVPGDATLQRLLGQALKFAGRVGASLLTYAGLPDLIASDLDDYRRRLVELVVNPQLLREYAAHLDRERNTLPLWDTRGFAAEFERLLEFAYGEVTSA